MLQLFFSRLARGRVQPTNLLPTGVVITSNKHHRRLLPTESFGPPTRSLLRYERSLRSYPIKVPSLNQGLWVAFDLAFFLFVSHLQQAFNHPSSSRKQLWVGHVFFRLGIT